METVYSVPCQVCPELRLVRDEIYQCVICEHLLDLEEVRNQAIVDLTKQLLGSARVRANAEARVEPIKLAKDLLRLNQELQALKKKLVKTKIKSE